MTTTENENKYVGLYVEHVPLNGNGNLSVAVDGTYIYAWEMIADILEPDGTLLSNSDLERGRWDVVDGMIEFSFEGSQAGLERSDARLAGRYRLDGKKLVPVTARPSITFERSP